jgi:hypothetical protein
MKTVLATMTLAAILCAAPGVAQAQDDDAEVTKMAKEHYKLGLDAYKSGHYDVAIKELKKAYLLKRIPALLLNIGATYRKMGDLDLALHFYKKYLEEAPPEARDRAEVQQTIADIQNEKAGGGAASGDSQPAAQPRSASKEEATTEAPPPPPPPKPVALPQEWSHNVIDAAPPDTPLDVRVSMPVMKGVKVFVYYRGAGEENFKPVLMKRHGAEKVGRIPAGAVQGKAIQYYVEARDPAGTVVKSSGSQSSPNIVMVDPSAPPQVVASIDERRERETEVREPAAETEEAPKAAKRNLDDESAPMSGNLDEERPHRVERERKPRKGLSTMMTAGIAVAAVGLGAIGAGIAMGVLAGQKASQISSDSQNPVDINNNHIFFNNDPNAGGTQEADLASQGKTFDAAGIALDVVGGAAVVAGVACIIADTVMGNAKDRPPKRHKRRRVVEPTEEESSAKPWYIVPTAGRSFAGVGAGFSF